MPLSSQLTITATFDSNIAKTLHRAQEMGSKWGAYFASQVTLAAPLQPKMIGNPKFLQLLLKHQLRK